MTGLKFRFTVFGLLLAAGLAWLAAWLTRLPALPAWILAASLVTFGLYGYDKLQARTGGPRVPEITLHGLVLAGGFAGGWLGRWAFRHKTRKPVFTIVLLASTVFYVGIILVMYWG